MVKKLLQFDSGHGPKSPAWDRVNQTNSGNYVAFHRQYFDYFKAAFPHTTSCFGGLSTCFRSIIGFTASSSYFAWQLIKVEKLLEP